MTKQNQRRGRNTSAQSAPKNEVEAWVNQTPPAKEEKEVDVAGKAKSLALAGNHRGAVYYLKEEMRKLALQRPGTLEGKQASTLLFLSELAGAKYPLGVCTLEGFKPMRAEIETPHNAAWRHLLAIQKGRDPKEASSRSVVCRALVMAMRAGLALERVRPAIVALVEFRIKCGDELKVEDKAAIGAIRVAERKEDETG